MQCKNCGTQIDPGNRFCENCGTPVPENETVVQADTEETYTSFALQNEADRQEDTATPDKIDDKPEKVKKNVNVPLIISVSVVVVVLIAALAIRFLPAVMNKDDKPALNNNEQSVSQNDDETTVRDFVGDNNTTSADSDIVSPDFSYNSVTYYVMPMEGLNLRKGPGTDYDSILTIRQNEAVEIIGGSDKSEDWTYVYHDGSGFFGWLATQYLSSTQTSSSAAPPSTPHGVDYYNESNTYEAYVRPAVGLNLRTGPGEQYDRITLLEEGTIITILGTAQEDREWSYIRYGTLYGFIKTEYVNSY